MRVSEKMTLLRGCVMLSAAGVLGCAAEQAGDVPSAISMGQATDQLDQLAREPMVVEHPDGTLFVTGYGAEHPILYRSRDGGTSWERVNIGTAADGAIGNSDSDLAISPDGSVHLVVMDFDRETLEGRAVAVGTTRGEGQDWSWRTLSRNRFDDRPWIESTPDGVLHVIWNDGAGVNYARSSDSGRTWQEMPRIHPKGGSSHIAAGPAGELAVRITPGSASGHKMDPDADFIAVSTNGGNSWQLETPPGSREWTFPMDDTVGVPRWVEPVAWDAAGTLYSLWSEGTTLWLGYSIDRGSAWSTVQIATSPDVMYFPYLVGNKRGELAATWYSGRGADLEANVAYINIDLSTGELVGINTLSFTVESFVQGANGEHTRDTAGEYVPVLFLSNGGMAVVSTIQDPANDRWGFRWHPIRLEW